MVCRTCLAGILFALFVATLSFFPRIAVADEKLLKTTPDRLEFGRVGEGARVEGSVRIYMDRPGSAGVKVNIEPPDFVKVMKVNFGDGMGLANDRMYCDLYIAIDTTKTGLLRGEVLIDLGKARAKLLVEARVGERPPDATRVLISETPFDHRSIDDASVFEPTLELIGSLNIHVDYTHELPYDLTGYDVILLAERELAIGIDDRDFGRLREFIGAGGRLILAADNFYGRTVQQANRFLGDHGMSMIDDAYGKPGLDSDDIEAKYVTADPLTAGIKRLTVRRPSYLHLWDAEKARFLVSDSPSKTTGGLVAVGRTASGGEVVALPESLWWKWLDDKKDNPDNARLMGNLLQRPKNIAVGHAVPGNILPRLTAETNK